MLVRLAILPFILSLAVAGCLGEAETPSLAADPEPVWTDAVLVESKTVEAQWAAMATACTPGGTSTVFVGGSAQGRLSPPENLTSLSLEFSWDAQNPTVESLAFYVVDGDSVMGSVEGVSPLVLEFPPEALAEMELEGDLEVFVEPSACPVAPANTSSTGTGQVIDLTGTYGHRVLADGTNGTAGVGHAA